MSNLLLKTTASRIVALSLLFAAAALSETPTSISPSSAAAGAPDFTLTVNGTGFVAATGVCWNGPANSAIACLSTTFVSSTQLTAVVSEHLISKTGTAHVCTFTLSTSAAPCQTGSLNFTITGTDVTTTVSPTSAAVGGPAFTLTVNGTGFGPGYLIFFNGASVPDTFVSSQRLTAAISAAAVGQFTGSTTVCVRSYIGDTSQNCAPFLITGPAPTITNLSPASAVAGGAGVLLTVLGTGFTTGSTVQWNGSARPTQLIGATQVSATLTAADIATAGTAQVTVLNTATSQTSNAVTFAITSPGNPVPSISSLSPFSAPAGASAFTLTVNGTGFLSSSVVQWNGSGRATTFVSATQLTATISAADVVNAGSPSITVLNPPPGGGASAAVSFQIASPVPFITLIAPAAATAGSGAFTLKVNGLSFARSAAVQWNGSSRSTNFVDSTQLTAAISASDIAAAATAQVTVSNPAPGGGVSNAFGFSIGPATGGSPVPAVTSISPTAISAGSPNVTLTVTGSGFITSSVVRWNGANRNTLYLSPTQIQATVYASDIVSAGPNQITVFTPPAGGGVSNANTFTVNPPAANPAPQVGTTLPSLIYAGGAASSLVVSGIGFVSGSIVQWNGANLTTVFTDSFTLSAQLPASLIAAIGTAQVTVLNPSPGGGISVAFTVTIAQSPASNPTPVVVSFSPSAWTAGGAGFIMKIRGTGFVPKSTVLINGQSHLATFLSDVLLWVNILASDVIVTGPLQVSVSNPSPGGGGSAAVTYSVLSPPVIFSGGIINGASLDPAQTPSAAGIGTLFGSSFGATTVLESTIPWPTSLGGVSLAINGILAPLLYVTPGQIGFQFPWELAGLTTVSAQVTINGVASAAQTITLQAFSPGVFTMTQSGSGQAAVLLANTYTLTAATGSVAGWDSRPAKTGEYIAIYVTGLGPVTNPPANGDAAGSNPLSYTLASPTVTIGGVVAPVIFSGLAPTLVGMYQIDAQIPPGVATGNAVPLLVKVGGAISNATTIAVQLVQ